MTQKITWQNRLRGLFRHGRKSATMGAGYLVADYVPGQPVWTPRRYDRLAEEGYMRNIIAFRAVDEIVRNAAAVPLMVKDSHGQCAAAHPVAALLAQPNPAMCGLSFRRACFADYLIAGNVYLEALPNVEGQVREIWRRRPDRVQVLAGKGGMPSGYRIQQDGGMKTIGIDPISGQSLVLHLKSHHPLDDWYGFSPLEAAAMSVDQFNSGSAWNQALLQNGAKPSGTLTSKEPLSEQQFVRLKEQLDDYYQGATHAGRPMLLEGGLSWQEMGVTPREMDYLQGKHSAAREIAQAFGVPPQLLGIPGDNTFSNYQEARLHFWENTVLPLVGYFAEQLGQWLGAHCCAEEAVTLCSCLDDLPALAPRRKQRWESISQADFLTLNEKRAALGYPPLAEGGDEGDG